MSVINIRGRVVKTSTRRWHHLDTDELARQQPGLYRDFECGCAGIAGTRLRERNSSINSSVEGKALLAGFTGTPALRRFCEGANAGRSSRLIEPERVPVSFFACSAGTRILADQHYAPEAPSGTASAPTKKSCPV